MGMITKQAKISRSQKGAQSKKRQVSSVDKYPRIYLKVLLLNGVSSNESNCSLYIRRERRNFGDFKIKISKVFKNLLKKCEAAFLRDRLRETGNRRGHNCFSL